MNAGLRSWGLAWRMLFNCGYPGTRVLLGAFGTFMALLAVVFVASNRTHASDVGAYVLGFGLSLIWGGYLPGLLPLQRQLDQWRMPGTQHLGLQAIALAALCSTVVPAGAFALFGVPFERSVAILAIGIAIGWGYSMLPAIIGAGMVFSPKIGAFVLDGLGVPQPYPAWLLLLIACGALGGVVWNWHFLRRQPDLDGVSGWRRSIYLTILANGGWTGWINRPGEGSSASRLRGTEAWLQDPGRVARDVDLHRPVAAVRTWLGAPFAPRSRMAWLKLLGFVGFLVALSVLLELNDARFDKDGGFLAFALVFGMGMFMVSHPVRLQALAQRRGSEWNELALLPGIPTSAAHRSVLVTLFGGGLVFMMLLAALVFHQSGNETWRLMLAISASAANTLIALFLSLRAIRGHVLHSGPLILLAVFINALLVPSCIWIIQPARNVLPYQILIAVWTCIAILAGGFCKHHWQRWIAQPHPFLQH